MNLLLVLFILMTTSCLNTKKAIYFNNIVDTTVQSNIQLPESYIQKNDLLNITVSSLNPEASVIFNSPNSSNAVVASSQQTGYLVNEDGNIEFPILGNLKAEGLTKDQLKKTISKALIDRKLLTDPIVSVRFLNFRVTVIGEVARPSVVMVPSEKISLLEAIGFAGDLTIYAKRNNVLLIRDENGLKTIKRLDLNSSELFTSPYYYLKSNDIVYVEPNKAKVASASRFHQWLPAVLSGLSFIAIVADRLIR